MMEDRASLPVEGHLLKGRPVNPAESQKGLGSGGAKYFRKHRRHPELKRRKLADVHKTSNQTFNSLYCLLMTAHHNPHTRWEAQSTMEHRKGELIRSINNMELSEPLKHSHPQFP